MKKHATGTLKCKIFMLIYIETKMLSKIVFKKLMFFLAYFILNEVVLWSVTTNHYLINLHFTIYHLNSSSVALYLVSITVTSVSITGCPSK